MSENDSDKQDDKVFVSGKKFDPKEATDHAEEDTAHAISHASPVNEEEMARLKRNAVAGTSSQSSTAQSDESTDSEDNSIDPNTDDD